MINLLSKLFTGIFICSFIYAQFTLKDDTPEKTNIQFLNKEIIFESQNNFIKIISPKGGTTTDYGRPELPRFSTLIQVEPNKEYSVTCDIIESHTITNINVFPFQNKDKTEEPGFIKFMDASFYEEDTVYPESILEVSDRLIMRDLHLLNVSVVPYRYNISQKTLEVLDEIQIVVTESGDREEENRAERLPSKIFDKLYSTLVLNYEERSRDTEYQPPSILYICGGNSEINGSFQQLVNWRHQRGYVVYTASLNETGSSSSSIKNFILNAYNTLSIPPEYVALVGDVGGSFSVPTFYESWGHNDYGGQCEGDHPYSQLEGADLLPEVLMGRISVRSTTELAIVVNKIIHYEKATFASTMLPYFEKAALIGDPSTASGYSTVITNEYISETMTTYGFEDVRLKISGGGWSSWMESQLNEGVLFFNYRGIQGVSGFDNGNIDDANNGYKLPFATIITCGTGSFAQDHTSMSEKFLRAGSVSNPKGGVAGIGTATWNTHTAFNNIIDMGIYDGIITKKIETAGGGLAHGKLALLNTYPTNPYNWVSAFTQWNNLMGDPATHLWTDTPETMTVQFESEIPFGTNFIDIYVENSNETPLENARVTLLKGNDEIFLNGFTNQNGNVTFDLDYTNGGDVNVTVTKQNVVPFIGDFEIITDGKLINIDTSQDIIIDDGEGGNQLINPGETINILIPLKNYGISNVTGIHAILESMSPHVTMLINEDNYGTIAPGTSSFGEGFTLSLNPSAIDGEDLSLRIHITDDSGENWTGAVPHFVFGGHLIIENNVFVEKDQTSNIQLTVKNIGTVSVENVFGELIYNDEYIEIIDGEREIGTIQPNETVTCLDCFTISTSHNVVSGTILSLPIRFYNANGYDNLQSLTLNISEVFSSDPLGPDQYGYYIYDMSDIGYNIALDYEWIEIDPDFGGPGTDLYLSDNGNGNFSNSSVIVELPFSFQFYGIDYENMTINSNGWIAMGETNMESFRNYPIPGAGGPSPMIAAFWDDLKTAYSGDVILFEDPDNQYVIVEWSNMRTQNQNSIEAFQAILYNSHAAPYGDGYIKIQYKTFNNTSSGNYAGNTPIHGGYCTIGIENHMGNDGLEYTFNNIYAPAASELENGSALLITTSLFENPTASFDYEVNNYSVFFTDLSSEGNFIELMEWAWDFGDGNTSSEPSPNYYYSSPGTYLVSLVVTSSAGLESTLFQSEISIESCTEQLDDCGVCGGENLYMDCNGQCGNWTPICSDESFDGFIGPSACEGYIGIGSDFIFSDSGGLDDCGICEGDNLSCTGCTDSEANNYNSENIFEDGSCTYIFYGPGFALNFDGGNDYVQIIEYDLGGVFDGGSNAFSFSAWIYPYDTEMNAESGVLVYHKDTFGNTNFSLEINSDGNLEVFIENLCGGNELVIGNGELQPGDWHHIAITYELGILSVFLDENIYENQTCGYSLTEINESILSFGGSSNNNTNLNGIMDEVKIWNYALDWEDISENMHDVINPEIEGLVGYWRFDETEGETTFDATSRNNNGQLIGAIERVESTVPFTLPPFINLTAFADTASWPVELIIGLFPDATNEYDFWVDRYAPPPPPPPTWDAALFNTIINDRLFVDIRPIPDNGEITEWAIDFQPDIGTEEITLSWSIDELVEGDFTLSDPFGGEMFSVNMRETESYSFNTSFTRVIVRHSVNNGLLISYSDGWNLVGLPLGVQNSSYEFLFPESVEETLYSYDDGYLYETSLTPGKGYWLRFSNDGYSEITGLPIVELNANLNAGWNLISGISSPILITSIIDTENIIVPNTLFMFTGSYTESELLEPGEGYWLRTFQEGEIIFLLDTVSSYRKNEVWGDPLEKINTLTFNNRTLYFGIDLPIKDKLSYSLPPKPPSEYPDNIFDVRFKGGWKITKDSGIIEVMNSNNTLSISYNIIIMAGDNQSWAIISESGEEYILEGKGEITIPSESIFTLIRKPHIPINFELHQNFPNPFNPTTTLNYDLPVDGYVTISIMDLLGREIINLVDDNQKAGFKSVKWNGTDSIGRQLGAGMYLYQLKTDGFVKTKKMVLIK